KTRGCIATPWWWMRTATSRRRCSTRATISSPGTASVTPIGPASKVAVARRRVAGGAQRGGGAGERRPRRDLHAHRRGGRAHAPARHRGRAARAPHGVRRPGGALPHPFLVLL